MSKFILTFLIGIAPIALLGMGAEVHAQDDVDCSRCVDTTDIAPNAVSTGKIRKRAVTTNRLAPQAVTTTKLAPQSVTNGKIKDGAVTFNKVAPKLSNAIGTSCPAGESVVGMNANGRFICESKLIQSLNPDLTGKTYCFFGQGTWLFADPGVSAGVTANPFIVRVDFTSSTQLTATTIYDPITGISISSIAPFFTIGDSVDDLGVEMLTYTVVANLLTITFFEDGEADTSRFIMAPDAQVFVGSFGQRGSDGTQQSWETGMIVGVQAANCDGLIG